MCQPSEEERKKEDENRKVGEKDIEARTRLKKEIRKIGVSVNRKRKRDERRKLEVGKRKKKNRCMCSLVRLFSCFLNSISLFY